jgi:hypothetical protein
MADKKSIFISYSSKDRKFVKNLVDSLEEQGFTCWIAPEMISAGSSYAREIPKAIRECQVFLLVLSENSQNSVWVEKETDNAISNRKVILPLQIDDAPLTDAFTFYLNNVQMISYVMNPEQAMEDLLLQLNLYAEKKIKRNQKESVNQMEENTNVGTDVLQTKKSKKSNYRQSTQKTETDILQEQSGDVLKKKNTHMSFARDPRNSNALRMNRIPLECRNCQCKELENVSVGTYRCKNCGTDNYDDFQTVRNYLDEVGNASVITIEHDTGVPRRVIEYFFKEEYLEIPSSSPIRIPCAGCGAPIRTGTLCDTCKLKKNSTSGATKITTTISRNKLASSDDSWYSKKHI